MSKKITRLLLLLSILIMVIGAIYIALIHHAYAISGCFCAAGVLLLLCYSSSKKNR